MLSGECVKMIEIENQIIINSYDTKKFDFQGMFADHCAEKFGTAEIGQIHNYIPSHLKPKELVKVGKDQATYAHSILYQIDPAYRLPDQPIDNFQKRGFIDTYQRFIDWLSDYVFGEKLVYQKLPTLRIQVPHNLSVGEYHRDRNYNHPLEEINIWVPITKATGTATIQMESSYQAEDFHPIEAQYGQYVIFDSALKHGNEVNVEDYTRVSFDFRVIPAAKYQATDSASINQKMKFRIGDYYSFNG